MSSLNKWSGIGHFGDDVQLHYFDNGDCVGKVSLATTEKYKKKGDSEYTVITQWHRLIFRNKVAEIVSKFTEKGSKIYVEGILRYRQYEKDGHKFQVAEVTVHNFEFLSVKKSDEGQNVPHHAGSTTKEARAITSEKVAEAVEDAQEAKEEDYDDLPF